MSCVLDEVSDVITDNDHRGGLCLCSSCTCGKHRCPFELKLPSSTKSMYKTSYKSNFTRHRVRPVSAEPKAQVQRTQYKFESDTTCKREFAPKPIERTLIRNSLSSSHIKQLPNKVRYRSRYQDEFKPWPSEFSKVTVEQKRMRRVKRFSASSTYASNYGNKPIRLVQPIKPKTNGNLVYMGYRETSTSTQKADFSGEWTHPSQPIKVQETSKLISSFPGQFRSSSSYYFGNNFTKAPLRRARYREFSNCVIQY